jgi:hypothetical protein
MSRARAFASLAELEFTDAEVAAVLARLERRRARFDRPRALAIAFAAAFLVAAVALAVPAGRAALDDAIERFFAGGQPPGEPAQTAELPQWLRDLQDEGGTRVHVLARSGDEELLAYRTQSGDVCFDFDNRVGICIPPDEEGGGADSFFDGEFEGKPVTLWGPTHRDSAGRWVLWGIALDAVARVELRYADGSSTAASGRNGFIVRADPARTPAKVVALDDIGRELALIDVRERFSLAPVGG